MREICRSSAKIWGYCWMLTQGCVRRGGLVLGYYPVSLREKDLYRLYLP